MVNRISAVMLCVMGNYFNFYKTAQIELYFFTNLCPITRFSTRPHTALNNQFIFSGKAR